MYLEFAARSRAPVRIGTTPNNNAWQWYVWRHAMAMCERWPLMGQHERAPDVTA